MSHLLQKADLLLVLHAHLPFVRSPEHARFLEENWFFEALTESYIPLVLSLQRSAERGLPGTINLSISPPLLHMLVDPLLQERYSLHLERVEELLENELARHPAGSDRHTAASFYRSRIRSIRHAWEQRFQRNLIPTLLELQDMGKLEILTCVGTHPYLPAYQSHPASIRFQLAITAESCKNILGFVPKGLWIPECGYFDGLDSLVKEAGFGYCFLETHGVLLARPEPAYGVFAPIQSSQKVSFFGRDQASSREVWSRQIGYPGHPEYREFFKDLAHELSHEELGDYFVAAGNAIHTGIKYHRITGSEQKEAYHPYKAQQLAREHGRMFLRNREAQVAELSPHMSHAPCIVAPYDAELFGHWWYEGPEFLESVMERAAISETVRLSSASYVLEKNRSESAPVHEPAFSSWGEGGYGSVWINDEVDWVYPLFYSMLSQFQQAFRQFRTGGFSGRVLAQMARELTLLQASDWAFMIHNRSAEGYAKNRVQEHHANFIKLHSLLKEGRTQSRFLNDLEKKNNIFPWLGPQHYRLLANAGA